MSTEGTLDARRILDAAESSVLRRRQDEVEDLRTLLDWADLHSVDPQSLPGAQPVEAGGDRLVQIGGDGTPPVSELCFAEIAVARRAGMTATRNAAAAVLDLEHRLPQFWLRVQHGECDTWVARKVAAMSRPLDRHQVRLVDLAVTEAIAESPGRILAVAEAKVAEADLEAQRKRVEDSENGRGVWFARRRTGDQVDGDGAPGTRGVAARLTDAEAHELQQTVDELSDALARECDGAPRSRDDLNADAMALLAHPHAAGHRRITLKPVIDLNTGTAVNGYEHPTAVKERGELRNIPDVFPHSAGPPGVRTDHDHTVPYDPHGPPGQTGDHNDAPLTRRHHRAKTHLGHRVRQFGPATYLWTTRHGLTRRVDPQGTTVVSPQEARVYEEAFECRFADPGAPGYRNTA